MDPGIVVRRLWEVSGESGWPRVPGWEHQMGGGRERCEVSSEGRVDIYAFSPPLTGDFFMNLPRTALRNVFC